MTRTKVEDYHDFGLTPGYKLLGAGEYRAAFLDEKTGMVIKIPISTDLNYDTGAKLNVTEQYGYAALDVEALAEHDVEYVETSFYNSSKSTKFAAVVQTYLDPELYEKVTHDEAAEFYSKLEDFTSLWDFHPGNMMRNKQTRKVVLFDCLQIFGN